MITRGKLRFRNGIYEGLIEGGDAVLAGKFTFDDGRIYIGEFEHNNIKGYGIMKMPNGTFYMGNFRNSIKDGRFIVVNKTAIYLNPSSYFVGDYSNDRRNGQGYEISGTTVISSYYQDDIGYGNAFSFDAYRGYETRYYNNGKLDFGNSINKRSIKFDLCEEIILYGDNGNGISSAKAISVDFYDHYIGRLNRLNNNDSALYNFECDGFKINNKDSIHVIFTQGHFKHTDYAKYVSGNVYRIDKDYIYFGGFNKVPNGTGVKSDKSGSYIQVGKFIDGKLYGRGLYINDGGTIEIGEFKNGSLSGHGVYYSTWTKEVYDGTFNNGKFERGYTSQARDEIKEVYAFSNEYLDSHNISKCESSSFNSNSNNLAKGTGCKTNFDLFKQNKVDNDVKNTTSIKVMGDTPKAIENRPVIKNPKSPLEIELSKNFSVKNEKELAKFICPSILVTCNIPQGTTKILKECFKDVNNVEKVILPSTIKSIGKGAFINSTIEEVDLSKTKIKKIDDQTFLNCTKLKTVILPDNDIELGNEVFKNCTSLESIDLKNTKSMGYGVFKGCSSLKEIDLSNLTHYTIANFVFNDCVNLSKVKLSSLITYIGSSAFDNCYNLKELDLSNINGFGDYALSNTGLTSIRLNDVYSIGKRAFYVCNNLTSFTMNKIEKPLEEEIFFGCVSLNEVDLPIEISELSKGLFKNCTSLKEFNFKNITKINEECFYNSGITKVNASNIERIEKDAFSSCSSLEEVVLYDTKEININAFNNCTKLSTYKLEKKVEIKKEEKIDKTSLTNEKSSDKDKFDINLFNDYSTYSVNISDRLGINGLKNNIEGCVNIPFGTLYFCLGKEDIKKLKKVTKIIFPLTLKELSIYSISFNKYPFLEEVDLSKANLEFLPEGIFKNCKKLKKVILPDTLEYIGMEEFMNCKSLVEVVARNVTYIAKDSFKNCKNLSILNISNDAKINVNAFNGVKEKDKLMNKYQNHVSI